MEGRTQCRGAISFKSRDQDRFGFPRGSRASVHVTPYPSPAALATGHGTDATEGSENQDRKRRSIKFCSVVMWKRVTVL